MWKQSTLGIAQPDRKNLIIRFWVKHFEKPSKEYSHYGGLISKLSLKLNRE